MTRPLHIALRLLLVACLAIYGSFATAGVAGQDGLFTIEICANGKAETIQVDANGVPVAPMSSCSDCVMCAQMAAAPAGPMVGVALDAALHGLAADLTAYETPAVEKPNTRPMPRGPPLSAHTAMALPCAGVDSDDQTRGVGRFQFKDALA